MPRRPKLPSNPSAINTVHQQSLNQIPNNCHYISKNHIRQILIKDQSDFLGRGSYGVVRIAKVHHKFLENPTEDEQAKKYIEVAVKSTESANESLIEEIDFFCKIFSKDCPNRKDKKSRKEGGKEKDLATLRRKSADEEDPLLHIVKFYGVTKGHGNFNNTFDIVMEKADGNLQDFLHGWQDTWRKIIVTKEWCPADFQQFSDESCSAFPWFHDIYRTNEYYDVVKHYELPTVFFWVKQLATALEYLHSIDIVHRDLKPGNILMFDFGRLLKICDFGTVRKIKSHMTADRGTLRWMAPEVMNSTSDRDSKIPYDHACDIYSLGVIFWEMITRVLPFEYLTNDINLHVHICIHKHTLPQIENCPKMVQKCIDRMISHDPKRRLSSSTIKDLMVNFLSAYKNTKEYLKILYNGEEEEEEGQNSSQKISFSDVETDSEDRSDNETVSEVTPSHSESQLSVYQNPANLEPLLTRSSRANTKSSMASNSNFSQSNHSISASSVTTTPIRKSQNQNQSSQNKTQRLKKSVFGNISRGSRQNLSSAKPKEAQSDREKEKDSPRSDSSMASHGKSMVQKSGSVLSPIGNMIHKATRLIRPTSRSESQNQLIDISKDPDIMTNSSYSTSHGTVVDGAPSVSDLTMDHPEVAAVTRGETESSSRPNIDSNYSIISRTEANEMPPEMISGDFKKVLTLDQNDRARELETYQTMKVLNRNCHHFTHNLDHFYSFLDPDKRPRRPMPGDETSEMICQHHCELAHTNYKTRFEIECLKVRIKMAKEYREEIKSYSVDAFSNKASRNMIQNRLKDRIEERDFERKNMEQDNIENLKRVEALCLELSELKETVKDMTPVKAKG